MKETIRKRITYLENEIESYEGSVLKYYPQNTLIYEQIKLKVAWMKLELALLQPILRGLEKAR